MPVVIPPQDEQDAIAAFLAHADRRINRFIHNKRRLIELLNEQKQAIINRAVTRGLDPNVRFKPSRIDWLGEVPEHWEVKRLKFLLAEPLKYGANEAAELADPDLPRYIRITDIDGEGRLLKDTFRSITEVKAKPYLLQDGDILLARSGATVGKSFLYLNCYSRAAYAGYLIRARFNHSLIDPEFAYACFNSRTYWRWLSLMTIQATIQNVSAEKYSTLPMLVPPLFEQKKILQKILTDSEPINKVIARARREINLIREYHTRLIANVVTGKLDVRHLPVEKIDEALEDIEEDEVMEVLEAFEDQGEEEEDESSQTC